MRINRDAWGLFSFERFTSTFFATIQKDLWIIVWNHFSNELWKNVRLFLYSYKCCCMSTAFVCHLKIAIFNNEFEERKKSFCINRILTPPETTKRMLYSYIFTFQDEEQNKGIAKRQQTVCLSNNFLRIESNFQIYLNWFSSRCS